MAFSSLSPYHHHHLDTSNWNQGTVASNGNRGSDGVSVVGPIRSMAERARMANFPMPESALKCPRCDSTNTKFCYFNNYSLSQPRHFCKTCRRYWTRGGALRNVPVGGGCRRNNKRSKSSRPKSEKQISAAISSSTSTGAGLLGLAPQLPPPPPPLPRLPENFIANQDFLGAGAVEQLFSGTLPLDSWRFNQPKNLPFLFGLDSSSANIHQFHGGDLLGLGHGGGTLLPKLSGSLFMHLESAKTEETTTLPLQKQQLNGNDHHWNNGAPNSWTEFQAFTSSSTGNPI